MKALRSALALLAAIIIFAAFLPGARADGWNQSTRVTFNNPVQVPGNKVLAPGTYWLVMPQAGTTIDRNDVLVYNAQRNHLIAMLPCVPAYRAQRTGKSIFTFAEQRNYAPDALMKWFYPGRKIGHEFLYSPRTQRRLNQDVAINVRGNRVQVG
ncbi:MAG TPA: hypothetical protein VMB47_18810 [Candidatus Aquilonibacter sp.]|nr:hypothetical protein [Candidatus Aquilonibacter sp.]